MNDEEWTDLTPSVDMEEGVGKRKYDKNDRIAEEKHDNDEKNDDEKEAEFSVLAPLVDMEEGVGKKIYDKNDRIDEETSEGENTDSVITTVNDAEGIDLTIYVDMGKVLILKK